MPARISSSTKRPPKPRLALVHYQSEPIWGSCKDISRNLQSCYRRAAIAEVVAFPYAATGDAGALWRLASQIRDFRPHRVVFVDHAPHPLPLLRALRAAYGASKLPELVFHVYGDFTLYPDAWLAAADVLRGVPCRFLCASERQVALLANLLREGRKNISLLPFPIESGTFFHSGRLRRVWRERLGFKGSERVFLYSGRISLQKNISLLLQAFTAFARTYPRGRMILAGAADDLGAPLFGWNPPLGAYTRDILGALNERGAKKIRWVGPVGAADLNGLYNAADCLVNLSLHHDEDYGMSQAEALSTGLPVCTTDWGGLASFVRQPDDGCLVGVTLSRSGLGIGGGDLARAFKSQLRRPADANLREIRAKRNGSLRSRERGVESLRELFAAPAAPFRGFSGALGTLAFHVQAGGAIPFPGGPRSGAEYQEIYAPYLRAGRANPGLGAWLSNRQWQAADKRSTVPPGLGHGWNFIRQPFALPVPACFLPQRSAGGSDPLGALKAERLLVRDGLVPLLSFFLRNPAPPRGFRTNLLIHEQWRSCIPRAWAPRCGLYRLGHRPASQLLAAGLPAHARRKWVTAASISPQFCTLPHLEHMLGAVKKGWPNSAMQALLEPGTPDTEFHRGFHRQLNGAFPAGVGPIQRHELTHFLDLRSHLYLDCNEKLLVADDAAFHLALSRGAVDPSWSPPKGRPGEFLRISSFHGFFLSELSSGYQPVWENPEFLEAWKYFRSMEKDPGPADPAATPFATWIWSFAVSELRRGFFLSRSP